MEELITITNIFGSLSLFFNLSLLFLIVSHPPKHLGAYKVNFYAMSTVDTLFALTQLIAAPCFFSDGNAYLIFSYRHIGVWPILSFLLIHNTLFVALSFNFLSRYVIVCNNVVTKFLVGKWRLRFHHLLNILEVVFSFGITVITFHVPERANKQLNRIYGERLQINFESNFILGSTNETLWTNIPNEVAQLYRMLAFIAFILFGLYNIIIMFFCGIGMYFYIKRHSQSLKLRRINSLILTILTVQATMSVVFVYTPGVLTAIFTITQIDGSNYAHALSSLMSFATFFTPLIVILLTKEYRTRFVSMLKCEPIHVSPSSIDIVVNNNRSRSDIL